MTKASAETDAPSVAPRDLGVGQAIREARLARGMTLAELGGAIERTAGYLSQIERGILRPPLPVLQSIADAIGVHPTWFLGSDDSEDSSSDAIFVRRGARRKLSYKGGITNELMSPNLLGPLELLMTILAPGSSSGDETSHRGHECGHIIKGKLAIQIDGRQVTLNEGDSFSFSSEKAHRFWNPTTEETKVVWVLTPPVI